MEPHEKGDMTEAVVIAELKRRNIPVSVPFGDNQRYDLVVETPDGLLVRSQVKTGWFREGVVQFKGQSQHTNAVGNTYKPYREGIDCFLVYSHEVESLFLVWEAEVGTNMSIRITDPQQRHETTNWASEYRFDEQWPPEDPRVRTVSGNRSPAVKPVGQWLRTQEIPFVQASAGPHHYLACDEAGERHTLRACSGSLVNGRIRFPTLEPSAVDAYCVNCSETDEIFLVPDKSFSKSISLRVESPDQPDASINWASEYRFDEQWPP